MLNSKFLIYNFFFVWLMQSHCSAMLNNLSQSFFCAATSSIVFKLGQFSSGNVQNLSLVLASAAPPVVGSLFNLFHPKIEEDKMKKQSSYFKQSFIFDLILAVLNYSFFSDEFSNEQLFKKINIIKLIAIPTLRFCYLVAVNEKEVAVNEKEVEVNEKEVEASRLNGEIASLEQEKKDGEVRKELLEQDNNSLRSDNDLSSNKIKRLEGEINNLKDQMKNIEKKKTEMEGEICSLNNEINFWNNEKSNWQKNIKNLEEVVLQKDGTNISLQKEKDNLKIKLNEASAKNKELKEQCENLKKEKEKISHELPAMKVESGVMNSMENWPSLSLIKIIDNENISDILPPSTENDDLEKKLKEKCQELKNLEERLQEIRNELSNLQALHKTTELKNKELQQELDELNNVGEGSIGKKMCSEKYSQGFLRMQLHLGLRFNPQESIQTFKFNLKILDDGDDGDDGSNQIFKEIIGLINPKPPLHGGLNMVPNVELLEEIITLLSGYSLNENDSILQ